MRQERLFRIEGNPGTCRLPIVVHVPHCGVAIPPEVREGIVLAESALQQELVRMTDWHTDELFQDVTRLGGVLFANRLSRLVVDPERFESDEQEPMAAVGMGAVYTATAAGARLRAPLSHRQRERLLAQFFRPYAKAFEDTVSALLNRFSRCLIVDAHSYPLCPLPYEANPAGERPPVCIGTDPFHTPEALVTAIEQTCRDAGVGTARDRPFAGCYVPFPYWRTDPRVVSVMIELRRDLYCDEGTEERSSGFRSTKALVNRILESSVHAGPGLLRAAHIPS